MSLTTDEWIDLILKLSMILVIFVPAFVLKVVMPLRREKKRKKHLRNVVKTRLLGVGNDVAVTTDTLDAIGRGVIGGAVAGPMGAAVGASTARRTVSSTGARQVTFLVYMRSGKKLIKTVSKGTPEYRRYMKKLAD